MSNCGVKHTKYQPTDEEWKCPLCGANDDGEHFYIDSFVEGSADDCELMHRDDTVVCTACDYAWTGEQISKIMAKIASMIPCPHCKGIGFVKKS